MSRKTKEEKLAEIKAEQEAQRIELENFRKDFPRKLVFEILPEFSKRRIPFRFDTNSDGTIRFVVEYDMYDDGDYRYVSDLSQVAPYEEEEIKSVLERFDEIKAAAQHRMKLRQSALNKLTEEEKRELGLK